MNLNPRKQAIPGSLTKLSRAAVQMLEPFKDAANIIRSYVAISVRLKDGQIGIHLQSNLSKDFPKFMPRTFKTQAGQTITAHENMNKFYVDGVPFNSGESFSVYHISS